VSGRDAFEREARGEVDRHTVGERVVARDAIRRVARGGRVAVGVRLEADVARADRDVVVELQGVAEAGVAAGVVTRRDVERGRARAFDHRVFDRRGARVVRLDAVVAAGARGYVPAGNVLCAAIVGVEPAVRRIRRIVVR